MKVVNKKALYIIKIKCEYCGYSMPRNKSFLKYDITTMKCPSCNKSSIDVIEEEIDGDINFA